MRIASWNVNGIRAVATKGFAESLEKIGADVIGIQEIKAMRDQLGPEITDIPGYRSWFYSAERKGYSGTALYSKIEPVSVEFGFGVEEFDHEGRVIKADFGDFVLYNIYFPNGGRGDDFVKFKLRFYDCFLDQVDELKAKGKEVICCGDVNTAHKEIDLSNPKANSKISGFLPEERAYMDKFIERGLTDTFRMLHPDDKECYTWWSYKTAARERNVGWRIDYFFTTDGLNSRVKESNMMTDIMGSDHCPIYLDLK
ncbi:exodeoxyribonuclease III [Butyrivibrio sp. AE2032]|uniref:exodeoxyribonuclease III n=1 Tax=Butyrivibrio sp. AE2032 TaxID=1458463 RepID=UPI00054CE8E9|nr:exodeoxyribonuclease III [Butyrivibrio sp. AE2032]